MHGTQQSYIAYGLLHKQRLNQKFLRCQPKKNLLSGKYGG